MAGVLTLSDSIITPMSRKRLDLLTGDNINLHYNNGDIIFKYSVI